MDEDEDRRREYIPHELVSEILTRLDVKSLTRFRSVSTLWNSTIVHPSFSKSHLSRSSAGAGAPVTLVLFFINRFNSERTIFSVKIPPKQTRSQPNPTRILTIPGFGHPFVSQSLNGLICFNLGAMCVCNPSTRKFLKLPWTITENPSPSRASTHHRKNAFGFDPVSDAHKVLDTWITYNENELIMEHKIFTVGAGCNKWWKIADGPPYFPFNESVCINGQIYFRALTSMTGSEEAVMVAFDVNREEFRFIQMHDDAIANSEEAVLIELDGHLAIVHHHDNELSMLVLTDEEDAKWVKKHVEVPAMCSEVNDRRRFKFAGTRFSGEMIFAARSLEKPFYVYFYDIKKNEAKKVEICGLADFKLDYSTVLMNTMSVCEHEETIKCLT
ncbi:hypothetical protein L2E82_22465 [Cichorium intybus]|uniref:Uncharacterized protein n=1 Tax=Cichorium intybus TaxID=13427 RepID=A0ACB9DY24_CICIN|nr:hypothetical protein L2E82_22465 [Cichorium intybus]